MQAAELLPSSRGTMPRPLRLNNPGAIKISHRNPWKGRVIPSADPVLEQFQSLEYGIRAMAITLETYFDTHELRTVSTIIDRWAPPDPRGDKNDTAAYIIHVAQRTGWHPQAQVNLHDPGSMMRLVLAIIWHENGYQPIPEAVIVKGLAMAGFVVPLKELSESRTLQGSRAVKAGTAVLLVDQLAERIPDIEQALQPLKAALPAVQYVLVGLAVAAILYGVLKVDRARKDDQARRIT